MNRSWAKHQHKRLVLRAKEQRRRQRAGLPFDGTVLPPPGGKITTSFIRWSTSSVIR